MQPEHEETRETHADMLPDKRKEHWWRYFVGGNGEHFEKMGRMQYDVLYRMGLQPQHRLIELGCGCFRAGKHIIPYLQRGNYFGVDADESVMLAGVEHEFNAEHFAKLPVLCVNTDCELTDCFFPKFENGKAVRGQKATFLEGPFFDFALSFNVFTHLAPRKMSQCAMFLERNLKVGGVFCTNTWDKLLKRVTDKFDRSVWTVVPMKHECEKDKTWLIITKRCAIWQNVVMKPTA